MKVKNQVNPSPERLMEFFGSDAGGTFVMVNLLKFKSRAQYPDGTDRGLTGAQAYAIYGRDVSVLLRKVGGRPIYSGAVTGLLLGEIEENWDMVALAEYPSLAAFQAMVTSPEYQEMAVHRTAGLAGQLNIRTVPLLPAGD